jgi:hypothetical protein
MPARPSAFTDAVLARSNDAAYEVERLKRKITYSVLTLVGDGMKKISIIVAVLLSFAVVGVTDTPSRAGKSAEELVDPCGLLSRTEAEQLAGEPFKDAERKENKVVGQKFCLYDAAGENSFRLFQIGITQQAFMPDSSRSPKAMYRALRENFPDAVKVEGVGDDAFIAPPGLHVLSGEYYISIAVGNSSNPGNRKILKAAGVKAVENLAKIVGN